MHETLSAAHVHAQYTSSEGGLENDHTQGAMKNDCKLNPRLVAEILWRDAGATSPDVVGSRIRISDEFAQDGLSIGAKDGGGGGGGRGEGEMIRGFNPRE